MLDAFTRIITTLALPQAQALKVKMSIEEVRRSGGESPARLSGGLGVGAISEVEDIPATGQTNVHNWRGLITLAGSESTISQSSLHFWQKGLDSVDISIINDLRLGEPEGSFGEDALKHARSIYHPHAAAIDLFLRRHAHSCKCIPLRSTSPAAFPLIPPSLHLKAY